MHRACQSSSEAKLGERPRLARVARFVEEIGQVLMRLPQDSRSALFVPRPRWVWQNDRDPVRDVLTRKARSSSSDNSTVDAGRTMKLTLARLDVPTFTNDGVALDVREPHPEDLDRPHLYNLSSSSTASASSTTSSSSGFQRAASGLAHRS
jgi:hypothetical protein